MCLQYILYPFTCHLCNFCRTPGLMSKLSNCIDEGALFDILCLVRYVEHHLLFLEPNQSILAVNKVLTFTLIKFPRFSSLKLILILKVQVQEFFTS